MGCEKRQLYCWRYCLAKIEEEIGRRGGEARDRTTVQASRRSDYISTRVDGVSVLNDERGAESTGEERRGSLSLSLSGETGVRPEFTFPGSRESYEHCCVLGRAIRAQVDGGPSPRGASTTKLGLARPSLDRRDELCSASCEVGTWTLPKRGV